MSDVLGGLAKVCGDDHAREATDEDTVAGVRPKWVTAPDSTETTSEVLTLAAGAGLSVVARGAGTKLDWGSPPERVDVLLDMSRMDALIDHAVGDLVVRAEPGLPIASLQAALAEQRQRLALDEGLPGATVGGAVATGTSGPLRLLHGTARDLLIGVTVVRADGAVTHAGGTVVKNVAGYDLCKLYTGSYGTLGVITETVFRLHPTPRASAYVSVTLPDAAAATEPVAALLHSQSTCTAIEIDRPQADAPVTVVALLEGVPDGLAARAQSCADLIGGSTSDSPPDWWGSYPFPDGGTAVKATARLSGVSTLLALIGAAAQQYGVPAAVRGSAAGALFVGLPADAPADAVAGCVRAIRDGSKRWDGSTIVLRAPAAVLAEVDQWGPVPGLSLMRRIKAQFDPERRLSPGRFAGGI